MDYQEQLKDERWSEIAKKVRIKNNYQCECCGRDENLHVHHKLYMARRKAWQYCLDDLMLLCEDCHAEEHAKGIPVYSEIGRLLKTLYAGKEPCPRCDGRGILPQYMHIQAGICFLCWGNCFYPLDLEIRTIENRNHNKYQYTSLPSAA